MMKIFLSLIFALGVIFLLINFIFLNKDTGQYQYSYSTKNNQTNFSIDKEDTQQFEKNMRYPSKEISYKIENCSIKKKNDFYNAVKIISNKTIISFYEVNSSEEIFVSCSDKIKMEEGLFIAGEGGPTKAIRSGEYYVITHGKVILIQESSCYNPNVAIHEILHALGFEHSNNEKNIMYNFSFCNQDIGQDTIELIDKLYSKDSLPDLYFQDTNLNYSNQLLSLNFSIRNIGLADSSEYKINILLDNAKIKTINSTGLKTGEGINFVLKNLRLKQKNFENITLEIESDFKELDKENNLLVLKKIKSN